MVPLRWWKPTVTQDVAASLLVEVQDSLTILCWSSEEVGSYKKGGGRRLVFYTHIFMTLLVKAMNDLKDFDNRDPNGMQNHIQVIK